MRTDQYGQMIYNEDDLVDMVMRGITLDHVWQIKVSPLEFGRRVHGQRLGAGAQNAQARRQHKAFLRTGNRHVDAPVIKAELQAT